MVALALLACEQKENPKTIKPLVQKNGLLFEDSTSTKPFTGRHKSKMLDLKIEYDVVNGIKEGDFIVYHPNSKIQMIGKMKNNKNVGFWKYYFLNGTCLLYTSDAADERSSVDLGGRRIIKKKTREDHSGSLSDRQINK